MRLIVIAGMHRSGTSFITELIRAMGAAVGSDLLEPAPDNPHGFFEHRNIKQLNDVVLSRLGGTWDRPPVGLSERWTSSAGLDRLRRSAENAINELLDEVAGSPACAIKDPRFSLTFPFWNSVVSINTSIVPLRNPHEVAQSLRHRNGFAPSRSAALWLRYTVDAVLLAPKPVIVPLDEVASDGEHGIRRLAAAVGLDGGANDAIALADDRDRAWQPADQFAPLTDEPSLSLATSVFDVLRRHDDLSPIRPILERLAAEWRAQPLDVQMGAEGARISAFDAATRRHGELQHQLEDLRLVAADYKDERDQSRGELRVTTQRSTTAAEQAATAAKQRDERIRVLEQQAAERDQAVNDEQRHRTDVERLVEDERAARALVDRQLEAERRLRADVERQAIDERKQREVADRRVKETAKRARAAERSYRRLRSRRSVRLALGVAQRFRPAIRVVRRIQRSGIPGKSEPERRAEPTRSDRRLADIRKTYTTFPASQDADTRRRLRDHLIAHPRLNDTLVSIVMPTYNRAGQIEGAMESVIAQTHRSWELLVVDDGSEDHTPTIMEQYSTEESRIRYIRNERGGVSHARNTALEAASGSVIGFLDTDNTWDPEFLSLMVAELDRSDADIAYSAMRVQQNGEVVSYRGDRFDFDEMRAGNYVDLNVLCHRRDLVADGARFDTSIRRTVDWDYLLEISRGRQVTYAPFVGGTYRFHEADDQISNREPYLYRKLVASRHDPNRAADAPRDARTLLRELTLDIAVCLAAPRDQRNAWGDYHFGTGLAQALERRGHHVRLFYHNETVERRHDVLVSLRGLTGHDRHPGTLHVLWSISHPELLDWDDIDDCDLFFSASLSWPRMLDWASPKPHHVLLQATDRARFFPRKDVRRSENVLFVGNSRNADRPLVARAAAAGLPLEVYGTRWDGRLPSEMIQGDYLANHELSEHYASAGLVLNDHWASMRDFGYVSNRVYDVLGSGGSLLSDHIPSIDRLFGDLVATVDDDDDIASAAARARAASPNATASTFVLDGHSLDDRADSLLAHIERHLIGGSVSVRPAAGHALDCPCRTLIDEATTGPNEREARGTGAVVVRGTASRLRVAVAPQTTRRGFTSSTYIRLVQPLTSEIDGIDIDLVRVEPERSGVTAKVALAGADAFVISRTALADESTAAEWLDAAETLSIPVVLDVDDAFHLMDETHPEFDLYRCQIDALRTVRARAAEIWVSTEPLAESITDAAGPVVVVPNSIDPRLWCLHRPLTDPPERDGDLGLEILYAGTVTHGPDFESIMPALEDLATRVDFRLTVVGVAPHLADRPWIRRMTPGDAGQYPRYATWIRDRSALFDVGIAPLVDNAFNRLKSDVKMLEYLAIDLVPLASDVGPYTRSRSLVTGGLCSTSGEWVDRLTELATERDALDQARHRTRAAREQMWTTRPAATTGAVLAARLIGLLAQ